MDPKLTLRIERLSELSTDELHGIGAAAADQALPTRQYQECLRTVFGCTTADTCPRPEHQ
jgi:hypothetical protein